MLVEDRHALPEHEVLHFRVHRPHGEEELELERKRQSCAARRTVVGVPRQLDVSLHRIDANPVEIERDCLVELVVELVAVGEHEVEVAQRGVAKAEFLLQQALDRQSC
ncbi:MAG TPA: hypothetical protein VIL20_18550 [Sandaracinaceae bacterium]